MHALSIGHREFDEKIIRILEPREGVNEVIPLAKINRNNVLEVFFCKMRDGKSLADLPSATY